jgi:hypothetical protein
LMTLLGEVIQERLAQLTTRETHRDNA